MFTKILGMFGISSKHAEETDENYLHGVNLREWHYLGYSIIEFAHTDRGMVFGFVHKTTHKRKIVLKSIPSNSMYKMVGHSWYLTVAEPWRAGELPIWKIALNWPSKYLRDLMEREYNIYWDNETEWWKKKTPEVTTEGNVLKVKFKTEE